MASNICRHKVFISFRRGGFEALLSCEVLLYTPDAWFFPNSVEVDYEIWSTRLFHKPQHMRPLEEIRADILELECETEGLL